MGQAWCQEKSTKAHDSKSPLDRVFLRCAHRIYPGLKDDSSMLGGATQRVTSSEIGYASSPPHSALTRGRSIDSVDRPFHPSEWVDINLEVPGTPLYNSACKNLPQNSNRSKSLTNMKDEIPVPPPRRRNKNRGRPLPPKPEDELTEDPLYISVKKEQKETYEYKVNGTGHSIPSDVVSKQPVDNSPDVKSYCKVACEDERDRLFLRRRSMHQRTDVSSASTNFAKQNAAKRPKNFSTSSLPNYDELDGVKHDVTNLSITDKFRNNHSANELGCILRENTDNGRSTRRNEDDNSIIAVNEACTDSSLADSAGPSLKLETAMKTSTPLKDAIGAPSISSKNLHEWFRRQDRSLNELKETYFTAILGEGESEVIPCQESAQQTLKRTLSNESEPFDSFEEKELTLQLNERPLIRSVSEESLPEEMLDVLDGTDNNSDIFYSKNGVTISARSRTITPPSTPEDKIKAVVYTNDGLRRKKLLEEDAESNLSSMTPSLTELEYALSDMLEKKETDCEKVGVDKKLYTWDRWLEPKMQFENDKTFVKDETILNTHEPGMQHLKNTRTPTSEIEIVGFDFKKKSPDQQQTELVIETEEILDPPVKPIRSHRVIIDESSPEHAPTPPRRRNRSSSSGQPKDVTGINDRLI